MPSAAPLDRHAWGQQRSVGFTLIELLVVISIIALLAAMLLPAISMVRDSAKASICTSNLRQVGMAFSAYGGENEGLMPPPYLVDRVTGLGVNYQASIDAGVPHYFWYGALVGYLEEAQSKASKVYTCPSSCFPKPSNRGWGLSYGYNRESHFFNRITILDNNCQTGYPLAQISHQSTQFFICERWGADPAGAPIEGWGTTPPYETYVPQSTPLHTGGSDPALRLSHRGGSTYLLFDGHVEVMTMWKQVNQAQVLAGSSGSASPNWWCGNP